MELQMGDVLTMKKNHPCGEKRWLLVGVSVELKLRCMGCGHEVSLPRAKAEKSIRSVRHPEGHI
jgi:hypothetical protein